MTQTLTLAALDRLVDTYPLGIKVENFGLRATVIGYQYSASLAAYTGNLILSDSSCKWIADPDKCIRVA